MPQHDDPGRDDFDDGTWHQPPEEKKPPEPPRDPTVPKPSGKDQPKGGRGPDPELGEQDSLNEPRDPAPHTVPGGETTIPPLSTSPGTGPSASSDSADSGDSTPRPDGLTSDDWDLLPAPTIAPGQVVFGKYLLEKKLGKGGMGEVWLVENLPLQKESALKLIDPKFAQAEKGWRRFEREARVMAKITHPNAVAVYDFRRTQSMAYIEMEYVQGCSLEQYLEDHKGPVSLEWTAKLLDQLCSVLQTAHGFVDKKSGKVRPIIHRDLKPSNLMLDEDKPDGQNLKVLDFGIAKMVQEEGSPELTGQGEFLGTPHYMSPEQINGGIGKDGRGDVDGRSDIYSVGVLLYQLLTGTLPFKARSKMEVLVAHLHQNPTPIREANPRVKLPAQVERLVMSCLEKDPDLRPTTARELAQRFRVAIGVEAETSTRPGIDWDAVIRKVAIPLAVVCALSLGALGVRKGLDILNRPKPEIEVPERPVTTQPTGSGVSAGTVKSSKGTRESTLAYVAHPKDRWAGRYRALGREELKEVADKLRLPLKSKNLDPRAAVAGLMVNEKPELVFYAASGGGYLPLGYSPYDSGDRENGMPRVLVRDSDETRFVWISGRTFKQGDFRGAKPDVDFEGNECTPHDVEVSGFYLQETEVTNKEIEEFLHANPGLRLGEWRKARDLLINDRKKAEVAVDRSPAVCINRRTAQEYAASVMGSLPTEAEWEFAARSKGQDQKWAWKKPGKGKPVAHLMNPLAPSPFPKEVRTFSGQDETEQGIFDMTGSVREWCLDAYRPYEEMLAGRAPESGPLKKPGLDGEFADVDPAARYVVKGGSFRTQADEAMTFQRGAVEASIEDLDLGFRVVLRCPLVHEAVDE